MTIYIKFFTFEDEYDKLCLRYSFLKSGIGTLGEELSGSFSGLLKDSGL